MSNEVSDRFVFDWRIKNYDACYLEGEEFIRSPDFTARNILGTRWYLQFHLKGSDEDFIEQAENYLVRCIRDSYDSKIKIGYSLELISPDGECLASCNKLKEEIVFDKYNDFDYDEINLSDHAVICESAYLFKKLKSQPEKSITLRCTIVNKEVSKKHIIGCDAETNFSVEHYNFVSNLKINGQLNWTGGKDFSFSRDSHFKVIFSSIKDELMIEIVKKSKTLFSQLIRCKIALFDSNEKERITKNTFHLYKLFKDTDVWKLSFCNKRQLKKDSEFLKFEFCCSRKYESTIVDYKYGKLSLDTYNPLRESFHALYVSKKHADVQLTVGEQIYRAHKSILSARSSVFSAMFDDDSIVNVDIPDSDPKTMSSFLLFLYTGTVEDIDFNTSLKLLRLADKYDIPSLTEKCSSFLMSIISKENVCEVLHIANLIHHGPLKRTAIDYIVSHSDSILSSPA